MSAALVDYLRRRFACSEEVLAAADRLSAAWDRGHTAVEVGPLEAAALTASPAVASSPQGEPRPLVLENGLLQSWRHSQAELELAQALRTRAASGASAPGSAVEAAFAKLFPDPGDPQAVAVRLGLDRGLALITGGPGTGKTHTAARLLGLLLEGEPRLNFALAAPTGKAAQRLGESMARAAASPEVRAALPAGAAALAAAPNRAATLHRLLEWNPAHDFCGRDARRPLELDLLLVDEAGMLDLLMWTALLRALPGACRLVVLGDPFQLESIAPGRVLGELVAAGDSGVLKGCRAELKRNYRFDAHPGIGALAQAVRARDAGAALEAAPVGAPEGAEVVRLEGDGAVAGLLDRVWGGVLRLARARESGEAQAALEGLRLLCALNEGPWGVEGINARIFARLEREGLGGGAWPVLVRANDAHSGLFNGDLGVMLPFPEGPRAVFFGGNAPRSFVPAQLPDHGPAWAMTVHRSQGSEYATVALVLPPEPLEWVGPELLYTAVTRAREKVVLAASAEVLRAACTAQPPRGTALGRRLGSS